MGRSGWSCSETNGLILPRPSKGSGMVSMDHSSVGSVEVFPREIMRCEAVVIMKSVKSSVE